MLTVRIGKTKMARRYNVKRVLQCMLAVTLLATFLIFVLQKYSDALKVDWHRTVSESVETSGHIIETPKKTAGLCVTRDCPEDQFSFYIHSGVANVMAPKICLQNKLVLGTVMNNVGIGINIVIINGKTGEVLKTGHFDMYAGVVQPLIELLQSIQKGSIVLMASLDEPSSKLTEEARKLIAELGSTAVQSLGFRDSWVFVGGKGASVQNNFEKIIKNVREKNKYQDWPELVELEGCIPKYLE